MYSDELVKEKNEINFPWLVFRLKNNLYAVNSKIITSIVIMPENMTIVPNVPDYIRGLIHLRGSVIPLLDLRMLFKIKSLKEEYNEFKDMIDDRKKDHINWVDEFEYSIINKEKFELTTNPHECEFGKWYDNFTSDIEIINFNLKKLDEPHKKIHKAADDLSNCSKNCDNCERDRCLKLILEETKEKNMPYMIELLDEVKEIFKMHYREMIVILEKDNSSVGITVDEVLSVEDIIPFEETDEVRKMCRDKYVCGVAKSEKNNDVLLILDEEKIMNISEIQDIKG
jgi:purine-binding chemotaxis protein CheW